MTDEVRRYYEQMATTPAQGGADSHTIPPNQLQEEALEVQLEFQPLDIACQVLGPETALVAVTDYFGGAVVLYTVTIDERGLTFSGRRQVDHVMYGKNRVRLFPDTDHIKGINRLDSVNFDADRGGLWIGRNGTRELFHLRPPAGDEKFWVLDDTTELPGEQGMDNWRISCRFVPGAMIYTTEGTRNEQIVMKRYLLDGGSTPSNGSIVAEGLAPGAHGLALHESRQLWNITRGQVNKQPHPCPGVYFGDRPVVPGIWGSSLCFLPNGALLVARYGLDDLGFFKKPGSLIYVPPSMLG